MKRDCGQGRLPDRCQRCVFWDAMSWQRTTTDVFSNASCVALPPSLGNDGYNARWPNVQAGHYCGGFVPIPEPVEVEGKVG